MSIFSTQTCVLGLALIAAARLHVDLVHVAEGHALLSRRRPGLAVRPAEPRGGGEENGQQARGLPQESGDHGWR